MSSSESTTPNGSENLAKAQSTIQSLSLIIGPLPSLESSESPAKSLLHDPELVAKLSAELRKPLSGTGDDNLCRWLYDTFNSGDTDLQLIVLSHIPTIVGIYLPRAVSRKPVAGFEAVLLALYSSETKARNGNPILVSIPDLSQPSLYHEAKHPTKSGVNEPNLAVYTPTLEPHGTMRATRRARIVGVALDLYYSKISLMPTTSKLDFCGFCEIWAGKNAAIVRRSQKEEKEETAEPSEEREEGQRVRDDNQDNKTRVNFDEYGEKGGRMPLPWELLQPILRILGHCLMGPISSRDLKDAAFFAVRSLYGRALHDVDSQAILATGSLFRLGKRAIAAEEEPVEPPESSTESSVPISFREPQGLLISM